MTNKSATATLQKPINHVVLVIDASYSMQHLAATVVKVVDNQIAYLAQRSKELDQETRVSVYTFSYYHNIQNLVYDMDVLRLPSIAQYYQPGGQTALIDATFKAIKDLEQTATLYGDHSFLLFTFTDGAENDSRQYTAEGLKRKLESLPDEWTVAAFVPNHNGVAEAKRFGFPAQNVSIWDATSAKGVEEAGEKVRQATDSYMTARSVVGSGFKGTKSLFTMDPANLNKATVKAAGLKALRANQFKTIKVGDNEPPEIRSWVLSKGEIFTIGKCFYQLTKREAIQPQKAVVVREKSTGKVFAGDATRDMLGLTSGDTVSVKPTANDKYDVFVQSTSTNRKLVPGTEVLLLV